MRLSKLYIRFFKSFNYDYLRKVTATDPTRLPWDTTAEGLFYPFVELPLDESFTTIVGANEAGKSQTLSAIETLLDHSEMHVADFCRYSEFFVIDKVMRLPEFGAEFRDLTDEDLLRVRDAARLTDVQDLNRFTYFRHDQTKATLYLPAATTWTQVDVVDPEAFARILPTPFRINSEVPIPDRVPLRTLAQGTSSVLGLHTREAKDRFFDLVEQHSKNGPLDAAQLPADLIEELKSLTKPAKRTRLETHHAKSLSLADDLLVKVAGIERAAFAEIERAARAGEEGHVNGLVEKVNVALAKSINFRKWWSQDDHFQLRVSLRDSDLVFTIRDRTDNDYTFDERSKGLKYFLSYLVQFLAHPQVANQEILLMDEPDAYLSSDGQKDLLRVLRGFAFPDDGRQSCQVVFVTHSPFLIDKNHAERIRVLEKGAGDEGTKVVKNVAKNHYEPLRSAFGGFLGETTFISGCNLILEGLSDQIIVAAMSDLLRRRSVPDSENLDLNEITLVPAGGASHVPYLVYLARGRDVERPATIVLLDSDGAGDRARKTILRGGAYNRQLLSDELILQVADADVASDGEAGRVRRTTNGVLVDIEDLIPLSIAVAAATVYVTEFVGGLKGGQSLLTPVPQPDEGVLEVVQRQAREQLNEPDLEIDKVGFARSLVSAIRRGEVPEADLEQLAFNFTILFRRLAFMKRTAIRDYESVRISDRMKRAKSNFLLDHPDHATQDQVKLFIESVHAQLDDSPDADNVRNGLVQLRRDFCGQDDPGTPVSDYASFADRLTRLHYLEVEKALNIKL